MSDTHPIIRVSQLACEIEFQPILHEVSFSLNHGQIGGLLGPSGCGKTTTLRCIAGFEAVSNGTIEISKEIVASPKKHLITEKRDIGMIFQDYALFPHLSVEQNIGFGLEHCNQSEKSKRINYYLDLVGLEKLRHKYPDELSGGQQQRVALARAIAPHPKLLLMDEPFSSLDIDLRRKLDLKVRDILKQENISAILVTHDQDEAFSMCDKVGVLAEGKMIQWDTPYSLYHEPNNRFIANFIGKGHFLRGAVINHEEMNTELGIIKGNRAYNFPKGSPVDILIRPDDIIPDANSPMKAKITKKSFQGAHTHYELTLNTGSKFEAIFRSHQDYQINEWVGIRLEADHLVAFKA